MTQFCAKELLIYSVLSFPSPINSFGDGLRQSHGVLMICRQHLSASVIDVNLISLSADSKNERVTFLAS